MVQAGKQLEILSGGLVKAGYHEVVYNAATDRAVQKMKQERPGRPLIRISSTLVSSLSTLSSPRQSLTEGCSPSSSGT